MEFNGNNLKIKSKVYAIDSIKDVDYSENLLMMKYVTVPSMLIFAPITYFYPSILMIVIYIILIGLSFINVKKYSIYIDDRNTAAFSTFDEDTYIAYKKELAFYMKNKQTTYSEPSQEIKTSRTIKTNVKIESEEEYKLRKRKEKQVDVNEHELQRDEVIKKSSTVEKGDDYENKIAGYYKLEGYHIHLNGSWQNRIEGGIDIICKKDDDVILIQCNNSDNAKISHITHSRVKEFHSNCIKYIEQNNLIKENVKLKYVVSSKKIFDASALNVLHDDYYNCEYEILEFK